MYWLYSKFPFFTNDQVLFLLQTVTREKFQELPDEDQSNLIFLFSRINSETDEQSLKNIVDCVAKSFLYNKKLDIFKVSEGENFRIHIETENDFSGYKLVARESATKQLLTDPTLEGNDDPIQTLIFEDLNLEEGRFYKIFFLLEESESGEASGDAVNLLDTAFFIVLNNIDSNE